MGKFGVYILVRQNDQKWLWSGLPLRWTEKNIYGSTEGSGCNTKNIATGRCASGWCTGIFRAYPHPMYPHATILKGPRRWAIAVAVYGNRDYDDALLELKNMLEEQAFWLSVQQQWSRSIRSLQRSLQGARMRGSRKLDLFSAERIERLQSGNPDELKELQVKGNKPYREISNVPMKPSADTTCTSCGLCARLCPVHAIDPANPRKTDQTRCISCTACIAACPQGARHFPKLMFVPASVAFEKV